MNDEFYRGKKKKRKKGKKCKNCRCFTRSISARARSQYTLVCSRLEGEGGGKGHAACARPTACEWLLYYQQFLLDPLILADLEALRHSHLSTAVSTSIRKAEKCLYLLTLEGDLRKRGDSLFKGAHLNAINESIYLYPHLRLSFDRIIIRRLKPEYCYDFLIYHFR